MLPETSVWGEPGSGPVMAPAASKFTATVGRPPIGPPVARRKNPCRTASAPSGEVAENGTRPRTPRRSRSVA
ncbi:MAG: hypothetical protein WAL67_17705, partial [Candidatus Cybelea sp.]